MSSQKSQILQLADLYEERDAGSPTQGRQNSMKLAKDPSRNDAAKTRDIADARVDHSHNILEMYKDIRSLMAESLEVLRGLKAVLAEPLSQSYHAEAAFLIRRFEKFCLAVYLFLVVLVLLGFFCWRGWYA